MSVNYGLLFTPETTVIEGLGEFERVTTNAGVLRLQREALGYTQQEVADAAKITLRQYQRFETGERDLRGASMRIGINVCKALGIDPHYFGDMSVSKLQETKGSK